MGQDATRQHFESRRFCSAPASAFWPSTGALNIFCPAQASQAIEKVDSARENPRKSKQKEPLSKACFGAQPRLDRAVQTMRSVVKSSRGPARVFHIGQLAYQSVARPWRGRKFFALFPFQPFENKRSVTLRGGKRRRPNAAIRAVTIRLGMPGRSSRGVRSNIARWMTVY
jgi:hypothetical protein